MVLAHSKITARGQISVPANIRKRLGIGPGSVIEWSEEGEKLVVRRAGKFPPRRFIERCFPKVLRSRQRLRT
jgi:AbrB family looped-hinge helix DNA binding protein